MAFNQKFMMGVRGDGVVFMKPIPQNMSENDAIELAATIISLIDPAMERVVPKIDEITNA